MNAGSHVSENTKRLANRLKIILNSYVMEDDIGLCSNWKRNDFRGWSKGLKKYGYATDAAYAEKLIGLIENYGLWVFDLAISASNVSLVDIPQRQKESENLENPVQVQEEENSIIENDNKMVAETTLAIPFYYFETKESVVGESKPSIASEVKPTVPRKMKIRPIMPHPNIQLTRRE